MILKYFCVFLLLSTGVMNSYCDAQTIQRNILQQAAQKALPGALIPQDRFKPFPQTSGEWRQLLPDSVISQLIKKGEADLKKDFKIIPATVTLEYVRTGNRLDYENIFFANRRQLWNMVIAESVEGKGRFTDHILNGVWAICEESFWGVNAHIRIQKAGAGLPDVEDPIVDLFSAETGALLSLTDYFVGAELDKVSKLIRPRIRYEINRRILVPMTTARYGWMGAGNPNARLNNWAPWIASNYILTNLLIEQDAHKRMAALDIAIKIIDHYINGLGADAGCDEGPGYWSAAGGCVFDALNLLYDATGGEIAIYSNPFIQKMGAYIYNTHISGRYFINIADARPAFMPDGLMIFRFGEKTGYMPLKNFGSLMFITYKEEVAEPGVFHSMRKLYNLLAIKECMAFAYREDPAGDVWYSDIQLMAARSENGMFLAAHGGHNAQSHNHNDVGDFIVYADGLPVIIDVGLGTYTSRTFSKDRYKLWFNTSPYHNLPGINGQEQKAGANYGASEVEYRNTTNSANLTMNIAGAYPAEAGVKSWRRKLSMNKRTGNIGIEDAFLMNTGPATITQSFLSVCDIDISVPGKIVFILPNQIKVYLDYENKFWDISKKKMELVSPEDQALKSSWNGKEIWRILLTSKSPASKGAITYRIHK